MLLCRVVAYLDRVNVGLSKLKMLQDLGFSVTIYGVGTDIFFIGQLLFEFPRHVILHRVGARAEAGFLPGIILYLNYWYAAERRTRMTAPFVTAVALGVVGGPIWGSILRSSGGVA